MQFFRLICLAEKLNLKKQQDGSRRRDILWTRVLIMTLVNQNSKVRQILCLLSKAYPDQNETGLDFKSPFELLVATILSAQTTDKQVNSITVKLFENHNQPEHFAGLTQNELESFIKRCGLYRNKSRNIIKTSQILVEKYDSQVPEKFSDLIELPGVGRKTANVIQSVLYGKPVIPVDTHIFRISKRLGLATGNKPEQVEKELLRAIPPGERSDFHHRLIAHGRAVCRARAPQCSQCVLASLCHTYLQQNHS